jgi:hypothetical protein
MAPSDVCQFIAMKYLRRLARICATKAGELAGITVISPNDRDNILKSAPHLAGYFLGKESIKAPSGRLPDNAADYLNAKNPVLGDLRTRYAQHPATDHSQWDLNYVAINLDLQYFRADNIYVYQSRRYSPLAFYATAAFAVRVDVSGLMTILQEDDYFGAELFDFHEKLVSRDLIDSVIEINFLQRHLSLNRSTDNFCVLDIGAGYGRLAHRLGNAFPDAKYYCIDAVPESTFICDYYLKFRKSSHQCIVVPLDKFGEIKPGQIDLAVNVHSFAECPISAISWWLERLRDLEVPYLFIATGSALGLTSNENGLREDFQPHLRRVGFKLVAKEAKFQGAPVLETYGLYPADYYLFQRA